MLSAGDPHMNRSALTTVVLLAAASWMLFAQSPAVQQNKIELNGHTFTLPAGFIIEQIAGPPLVDRPISADFDEQGRLYVSDSSGSNEKVKEQLQKKPHRIVRLEDTDGDGKFDKHTVFADKMMFPEGTMWYAGSLYVAAPPEIWKLTDTDKDGIADKREVWFDGKTLTGCANDLHGPYLGPDGWIYWCKGAFAQQTYERPGKKPFVTRAAHIFRARPDATGIEPVMTGGMDNPVDVVFTPGGERIFTTTFFQRPAAGKRDGLIHAVYGGIYGKDYDVIYEPVHKWTGPDVMPVLTHLGPAAPCGLHRFESNAFGPEYRDNIFACSFNLQKVTRHVVEADGATFKTRDSDFVISDNKDFHPTDVIEDADGSLLIVDTGGWYKLCCPTSQLVKPDVLGAIYRVRKKGSPRNADPRGLKLDWERMAPKDVAKLVADDPRPAVRQRAVNLLAKMDALEEICVLLLRGRTARVRRDAVWAATRIADGAARVISSAGLEDRDETVRQAAIHSAALWRSSHAVTALIDLLKGPSLHNRRAAAEALGRIGDPKAVPALLEALARPSDRVLEHSLIYALIEIGDAEETAKGLDSASVNTQRAALIALDQMEGSKVEPATVAPSLKAADARMRETAWWIAGRHPEWGEAMAGFLRERLASVKEQTASERDELVGHLARFAKTPTVQKLLAERLRSAEADGGERATVLRAMARTNLKVAPDAWVESLTELLEAADADTMQEAAATVRALRVLKATKLAAALVRHGQNGRLPAEVRLHALAAIPGGLSEVDRPLFDFLIAQLDREQPVTNRGLAGEALARARLDSHQLVALAGALKTVNPLEVNRLLEAFAKSKDDKVGLTLVAALKASAAKSGLRPDTLKPHLAKFSPAVQKQAEALYAALSADAAQQKAKLEQLLTTLDLGDIRRGQAVFNSNKAACASCHTIGYVGGKLGPDLTRIGSIRTERDLLESIVFPSASFVQGYQSVVVSTKDGRVYSGVVRKDAADEVVIAFSAFGAEHELRISRADIEDMEPSQVSVMPSGLDQQLTQRELADLVAFLKACR
jgi:putative membrane-bound dehydrogenase-like protein